MITILPTLFGDKYCEASYVSVENLDQNLWQLDVQYYSLSGTDAHRERMLGLMKVAAALHQSKQRKPFFGKNEPDQLTPVQRAKLEKMVDVLIKSAENFINFDEIK